MADRYGPYEIVASLGAGGMGEVYLARDTRLHRDVALKVLPGTIASDSDRRRRFLQEARAAAALNHPGIVAVYDVDFESEVPFLVTELIDGRTLRQEVDCGPLPLRRAIDFAAQLADALGAAHAADIVHRDLKPENIMVTREGRTKILDLGLAKILSTAGHAAGGKLLAGCSRERRLACLRGHSLPNRVPRRLEAWRQDRKVDDRPLARAGAMN